LYFNLNIQLILMRWRRTALLLAVLFEVL